MVGHPGENQKEFEHLLDFIKKFKFDRLGVFEYSPEEGTNSFTLNDDIPNETKKKRASLIMEEQQTISLELNSKKINKQFKVLVDRIEGNTAYARTEFDSPEVDNEVIIQNGSHLHAGDFKLVKVTDALEFDLIANCNNP